MNIRKILSVGMILFLFFAAGTGCSPSSNTQTSPTVSAVVTDTPSTNPPSDTAADKNTVIMSGFKFQPAEITINKGDTVTWTNQDSARHDVVGSTFKSALFGKGESFSQTFNETGTFDYVCSAHAGMVGSVIVK